MSEFARRRGLQLIVDHGDERFDPDLGLLLPARASSTADRGGALVESAHYALALLELAEFSRQGRAEAIIDRIIETDTSGKRTEPFLALALFSIRARHRRRLSVDLVGRLEAKAALSAGPGASMWVTAPQHPEAFVEVAAAFAEAAVLGGTARRTRCTARLRALNACLTGAKRDREVPERDVAAALTAIYLAKAHFGDARLHGILDQSILGLWQHLLDADLCASLGRPGAVPVSRLLAALIEFGSDGAISVVADETESPLSATPAFVIDVHLPRAVHEAFARRSAVATRRGAGRGFGLTLQP